MSDTFDADEFVAFEFESTDQPWRISPSRFFGKPGFGYRAFLTWNGNQIGDLMPMYVARAAASRLNQLRVNPDLSKKGEVSK